MDSGETEIQAVPPEHLSQERVVFIYPPVGLILYFFMGCSMALFAAVALFVMFDGGIEITQGRLICLALFGAPAWVIFRQFNRNLTYFVVDRDGITQGPFGRRRTIRFNEVTEALRSGDGIVLKAGAQQISASSELSDYPTLCERLYARFPELVARAPSAKTQPEGTAQERGGDRDLVSAERVTLPAGLSIKPLVIEWAMYSGSVFLTWFYSPILAVACFGAFVFCYARNPLVRLQLSQALLRPHYCVFTRDSVEEFICPNESAIVHPADTVRSILLGRRGGLLAEECFLEIHVDGKDLPVGRGMRKEEILRAYHALRAMYPDAYCEIVPTRSI